MATASVHQIDPQVPKHLSNGDSIGARQLQVDSSVKLDAEGCCALAVYLYDHQNLIPDEPIASDERRG